MQIEDMNKLLILTLKTLGYDFYPGLAKFEAFSEHLKEKYKPEVESVTKFWVEMGGIEVKKWRRFQDKS